VESRSTRTYSEKRRAKRNRYRRNRRTRNLLARAAADPSFILDISQLNINLPITKIFLNNIQEDSRDAPYLSPGTLEPSYSPVYT